MNLFPHHEHYVQDLIYVIGFTCVVVAVVTALWFAVAGVIQGWTVWQEACFRTDELNDRIANGFERPFDQEQPRPRHLHPTT